MSIFPFQKVDNDTFHELFADINTKAFFQTIDSQVNIRDISSSFYLTPTNMNEQYQAAKHFFLLHINTRSLAKNLNQVKDLLISIGKIPDIIAISETKLRNEGFHNVSREGFEFVHHNSPTNAGGVGLYIKQGINFNLITKPNLNIEGCEDIWIDVKMDKNKKVVIGAIYRHPKSNFIDFQTSFVNTIELLNALSATYYIAGDINIDLSKSDNNANIADYVNTLHSMGCSQVIASPTQNPLG